MREEARGEGGEAQRSRGEESGTEGMAGFAKGAENEGGDRMLRKEQAFRRTANRCPRLERSSDGQALADAASPVPGSDGRKATWGRSAQPSPP